MASTRSHNVSVLHFPNLMEERDYPITAFSDTGGSLRSAPRNNQIKLDSETYLAKKKMSFYTQDASQPGTLPKCRSNDQSSKQPLNVLISGVGNSVNSSGRELSPVRWCDREVDGVYLGKSGWVQVQQRFLDANKKPANSKSNVASKTGQQNNMSSYDYSEEKNEKFEQEKPAFLPIPKENRSNREFHKTPSPLALNLVSNSPPSITPIISPPPAFKDPGLEAQKALFRRSTTGKTPFLLRSNAVFECESPPESPPSEFNSRNFKTSRLKKLTSFPVSSSVHRQNHSRHIQQAKSLEENISERGQLIRQHNNGFYSNANNHVNLSSTLKTSATASSLREYSDKENCSDCIKALMSTLEDFEEKRLSSQDVFQSNYLRKGRRKSNLDSTKSKQYSKRLSSSTSSSSTSSLSSSSSLSELTNNNGYDKKFSNSTFRRNALQKNRQRSENSFFWDVKDLKVRRSRSLQLPEEKRSPDAQILTNSSYEKTWNYAPDYYFALENMEDSPQNSFPFPASSASGQSSYSVTASDQSRNRFYIHQADKKQEMLRQAEEEAQIVSDYINGTRSQEAARNLLMHRYLNRSEDDNLSAMPNTSAENDYRNNRFWRGIKKSEKKKSQQKNDNQQNYGKQYFQNGHFNATQYSDFWPEFVDAEKLPYSKASSPSSVCSSSTNLSNSIKSSQSYPNQKKAEKINKKEYKNGGGPRSSPASLNSMTDSEPKKILQKSEVPYDYSSSSYYKDKNYISSKKDKCQIFSHNNDEQATKSLPKYKTEKLKGKGENGSRSSFKGVRQSISSEMNFEKQRKLVGSPLKSSSESSSSSDVCLNAKHSRSLKSQKSSKGNTPLEEYGSANFKANPGHLKSVSPQEPLSRRPGSAPADDDDRLYLDAQKRSLSLPKSFLSDRYGFRHNKQSKFPWRPEFIKQNELTIEETPLGCDGLYPDISKTAPATPIRDLRNQKKNENLNKLNQTKSSSTSLLDETPVLNAEFPSLHRSGGKKDGNSRVNFSTFSSAGEYKETSPRISGSESVLDKFKKSISMRFTKGKSTSKSQCEETNHAADMFTVENISSPKPEQNEIQNNVETTGDLKFKFGPLTWRSSNERKKSKKAGRNAKCNSGDSGIQVETAGIFGGESSESHDTDQPDDMGSPSPGRLRGSRKFLKPQSEFINQILRDKFQSDYPCRTQGRRHLRGREIRRTSSDLGGQRLFNWNLRNQYIKLLSASSSARDVHIKRSSGESGSNDQVDRCSSGRILKGPPLRRSLSQPVGLNKLSPLFRPRALSMKFSNLSEDERDQFGVTSEDEAISDSESSLASLVSDRKKLFDSKTHEDVIYAEALWDHIAMELDELPFRAGDVIEVLDTYDKEWWWGTTGENFGYFPSAFVRLRVSQEETVENCLESLASGKKNSGLIKKASVSLLSNDQVRSSVVREIFNTERDFVKILEDVTEGYVAECRRRTDMFKPSQIKAIFSNIEELLAFQKRFLKDLEDRVDFNSPHKSCIGEIFLNHRSGFKIYSEYCNAHPMAIATLQELYQRNSYIKFFEACRLMRGLVEIPLDGYLLTPVQRICKYPLQLAELLKYTKADHPDHETVKQALDCMKKVASLINERKRKMESLEKLASWQQRVEGWEGEDLIDISSQLVHQGEAFRVTSGVWSNNITLFLFDHQIVYCKKDLLKRNSYVYKGRIFLDTSEVFDLPDGKNQQYGVTIKHGVKIYNYMDDKWLIFCCRSSEEKAKWLDALQEERKLVALDKLEGLELPTAARQLAKIAAGSKRGPTTKPRHKGLNSEFKYRKGNRIDDCANTFAEKSGRKVGNWFTFKGGVKNSRAGRKQGNSSLYAT